VVRGDDNAGIDGHHFRQSANGQRSTTMIGTQDLLIALAIGVFFFGAKKLPELSRSLGKAMSEFKKGIEETSDEKPTAPAAPEKPEAK